MQPLVDFIMDKFKTTDYNGESSFDAVKICAFFRAVYEELGWRFSSWTDEMVERYWSELSSEHVEV